MFNPFHILRGRNLCFYLRSYGMIKKVVSFLAIYTERLIILVQAGAVHGCTANESKDEG